MVKTETYATQPAAFIDQPFAAPHQSAGSEAPSDSFPPGEAKGGSRKLVSFIEQLNDTGVAGGCDPPLQSAYKTV